MLNLPTEVVASQFLTMGDEQFSTSRGHVVYVRDVLRDYGPDPLRYFICAAGPESQDAEFTWSRRSSSATTPSSSPGGATSSTGPRR